jgi:hypothetical protein
MSFQNVAASPQSSPSRKRKLTTTPFGCGGLLIFCVIHFIIFLKEGCKLHTPRLYFSGFYRPGKNPAFFAYYNMMIIL